MPNVNIASISPILKIIYEEPISRNIQNETVLTQRIESTNKGVVHRAGGKYVDFPVLVGRNQGISFRGENEDLGDVGRARLKDVQVPLYYGYGRCRISGQLFEIAETDVQAFANAVSNEMDVLKESVSKDQNRIFYGNGLGSLATILTTSGAVNTVTVDDAYWIEIDQQVDIITISNGAIVASARNVTAVDYAANTVTFDGATVAVTSGLQMFTRFGNYNNATGTGALGVAQREPSGLARIADNTINLFGLNDAVWKAKTTALNSNLSETAMIKVCDEIRRAGGMVTAIFTSLGVRRSYFNLLTQQRRFDNTVTFSGGFEGLPFLYAGKKIPLMEDPDCPSGRMYFLPEKEMRVYHTKDWHFEDKTGSMFVQFPNKDVFDVLMKRYFELGIRRRNGLGALTGIVEN
jgi:hypothetical protein